MTHPISKIDVLLTLIRQTCGSAELTENEKEMRNANPERLALVLSYAYLKACKVYGQKPTREFSWLNTLIDKQEEDEKAAAQWD